MPGQTEATETHRDMGTFVVYAKREMTSEDGHKKMAYVFSKNKDFSDSISTCKDIRILGLDIFPGRPVRIRLEIEDMEFCPHCSKPI